METYVTVRVHGLILHLLGREDYERLLRGADISEFPEYSQVKMGEPLNKILAEIDTVFIQRLKFLEKLQSRYSPFITAFGDRLELENIKVKLRELYGKRGEKTLYTGYSHYIPLDRFKELTDEEELWALLQDTPYHTIISIREILDAPLEFKEAYLDSCYYQYIKSVLPRDRKKELGRLIDLEGFIAYAYWKILLKENEINAIYHGFKPRFAEVKELKMENICASLRLRWEDVEKLIERYEISKFIKELKNAHLKLVKSEAGKASLSPIFLYYYLLLAKYERDNLHRIIMGRIMELKREKIEEALLFL